MNGLATSCDAEVSKPPANARKSQGTDSRGGLGERDKAPGAIISNNSYINLEPQKQQRRTGPKPPRHGDHQRRSRRQSHDEPEGGAAGFLAVRFFWRFLVG